MYYKNYQTKNKYKAKKTMFNGMKYDSKKEAEYAMWLTSEMKAGRIKDWQKQVRFDLYGENKSRICYYKADFVIDYEDGTKEIVDVKSKITETPYFRLKWKLLEDKYKYEIKRGEVKLTIQY
jgi:hypothetical protein